MITDVLRIWLSELITSTLFYEQFLFMVHSYTLFCAYFVTAVSFVLEWALFQSCLMSVGPLMQLPERPIFELEMSCHCLWRNKWSYQKPRFRSWCCLLAVLTYDIVVISWLQRAIQLNQEKSMVTWWWYWAKIGNFSLPAYCIFTALHGMQMRSIAMRKLPVCLSVCPSVCQTPELWKKRKKDLSRFLHRTKDHLA